MKAFDLVIIGGGPIGLACAIEATKKGLSYIVLEKGVLVNSIYHFPTNMTFFSTSKLLEIGGVPFISHVDKPTRSEALEYYRRVVESWHINIHYYEEVMGMEHTDQSYVVRTQSNQYKAQHVIVATGFYDTPNKMNIPGEDLAKVKHYYDDPHPYVGQEVAIIGAGNSGADAALECYHKGAHVTLIVRHPTIKSTVKYWIRPNLENRIKEGSIKAYFDTQVREIHTDHLVLEKDGKEFRIPNHFVLAMTGYKPNYPFLTSLGLSFLDDEHQTPTCAQDTLETNLPGVYIAGVVCGGLKTNRLFIENARVHAEMIVQDIITKMAE